MKRSLKVSRENDRPLQQRYFREIFRNLTRIKKSIDQLLHSPSNKDLLVQVKHAARSIADLALIHGYDGVEKLAGKICSIFANLIRTNHRFTHALHSKVNLAVLSIRQLAELEDAVEREMTVERASDHVQRGQRNVQSLTEEAAQKFDYLRNRQLEIFAEESADSMGLRKQSENPLPVFDIRELDWVVEMEKRARVKEYTLDLFA